MNKIIAAALLIATLLPVRAQVSDGRPEGNFFKAAGTPVNPRVPVSWNRYYTNEGLHDISRRLAGAYPELVSLESIGKSHEGRDIWLLRVTNHRNKPHREKPGFWIDGNIHANEIQGSEIALYTAWYLVENYGNNPFVTSLLDDKVFYIVPTINPDGRHEYMANPNTGSSPRSGTVPLDDDGDGQAVEDGFDDLNGDGHITQMRRRNPLGQYREHPDDPRMLVPVKPGEFGQWELLGFEGIDRDGDGRVNEDRVGYYDPNRDWGWNWQPDYVQRGAYLYPFSLPENRAVRDFVTAHPNIAGAQTYHNSGGMILRGPGTREDEQMYTRQDRMVYDAIGELGDRLLPGYRYMILYSDLYTVYGGQIDWFHFNRGIFTFTNELMTPYLYYYETYSDRQASQEASYHFDRHLLFEDAFVPWEDYEHPQYGKIQVGGFKKNHGRIHPGFMMEQDFHRNMAFTLHHAWHTPQLEVHELSVKELGGGLREVTAVVANTRLIPTHSGIDLRYRIERPDYISLEGARVLGGMRVLNRDLNVVEEQKVNPSVIEIDNIPGMGSVTVRWIVDGGREITVTAESRKGGLVRATTRP
jgi:hypothetical protein